MEARAEPDPETELTDAWSDAGQSIRRDGLWHRPADGFVPWLQARYAIRVVIYLTLGLFGLVWVGFHPGLAISTKILLLCLWFGCIPLFGTYAWFWPRVVYRHYSFCLDDFHLYLREGVWWRSETMVPFNRIQHTDIQRGPLQRANGIATLVVHTAGLRYALVAVEGVPGDQAMELRRQLQPGPETAAAEPPAPVSGSDHPA